MPNWTENYVEVKGSPEAIKEFREFVMTKGESSGKEAMCFDFNNILPMPEALCIEAGSTVYRGLKAHEEGADAFMKLEPAARLMTRKAILNCHAYGRKDWYDWCNSVWGTKWNACDDVIEIDEDDYLAYSFNTAWCGPKGVAEALAEAFPELDISWRCLNEEDSCVLNPNADEDSEDTWVYTCLCDNPNTYHLI